MTKILILAPYREPTGYGEASRRYIKSLISTGAEISCRPIVMSDKDLEPDEEISKTEENDFEPDAVLQICPPYLFEKLVKPSYGLFFTETNPLPDLWALFCSNMDGIINPSAAQHQWCFNNVNFFVKDTVINIPARPKSFYETWRNRPKWMNQNTFKFYTIGEDTERKNLRGIIKAYFSAFSAKDPVELIIKTNKPIDVLEVADKCNIQNFPDVQVIHKYMDEEELAALHQHSNCFVQASYSEGFSLPCFDALFFGKTPIAPFSGGYKEFLNSDNSYLIDCREEFCYNGGKVHSELFDCSKTWFSPNLKTLSTQMLLAHRVDETRRAKAGRRFLDFDKFTTDTIGRKLLGVLNENEKKG